MFCLFTSLLLELNLKYKENISYILFEKVGFIFLYLLGKYILSILEKHNKYFSYSLYYVYYLVFLTKMLY